MRPNHHLTRLLDTALAVHQSGSLEQAASLYTRILAEYPGQADALYLFGVLHHQLERHQEAVALFLKAIEGNKRKPEWYNTLGEAYRALGQPDKAIQAYRRALKLAPGLIEALGNLGLALHDQGQLAEAAQCYERVLRMAPHSLPALINLGSVYQDQGRHKEAALQYQAALSLDQNCAEAHFNLGLLHYKKERYQDALRHLEFATQLQPDNAEAWLGLGKAHGKLREHERALNDFEHALVLRPRHAETEYQLALSLVALEREEEAARSFQQVVSRCRDVLAGQSDNADTLCLLGNALRELGEQDEAAACFTRAIAIAPSHGEALLNLGSLLYSAWRYGEARLVFDRAIALQPEHPHAYLNRGLALQKLGELEAARASLLTALHQRPEYPETDFGLGGVYLDMGMMEDSLAHTRRGMQAMPEDTQARSNLLFALNYGECPAEQVFREHLDFGVCHSGPARTAVRSWPNDLTATRPLRVGYLSPDFRTHSVAYFIEPILAAHDQSGFEVFCYANVAFGDAVTTRLQGYPIVWRDIHRLSDRQACDLIREDAIDILVDLAGHTGGNRMKVFARKPAPVQVTYLGYPNTTGLEEVDYRITDAWADPVGLTDAYYSERLARLPHGFLCYRPGETSPPVLDVPALTQGHVTFGSFNTLAKVTDSMISLWCRILNAVPGSRFVFKSKAFAEQTVRARIEHAFSEQGVDMSRLDLMAWVPSTEGHLGVYSGIDIALDTFPYHGTTTTFEALWMGVPVVTLAGEVHAARVGVSILSRMGLSELIAHAADDYVHIAVDLAGDLLRLQGLRQSMRQRMEENGLTDAKIITREIELAFQDMWRSYCEKQSGIGE